MLVEGEYQPINIIQVDQTHYWGLSPLLNLALCWEEGYLRWWDPVGRRYLRTFDEEADGREGELQARLVAEAQRDQAESQRQQAEARVRELEAQLRRLQDE